MIRRAAALLVLLAVPLACGDSARERARARVRAAEETARAESLEAAADTLKKTFGPVIQMGSFAEEARAKAMRDELLEEGWRPWVTRATVQGEERWRVNVAPLYDGYKLSLARVMSDVLHAHGRDALLTEDSVPALPRGDSTSVFEGWISTTPVSQNQGFMIGQARWLLSPDSTAMLVVQQNTGVENEPLPNEFIYVSEREGLWGPIRSWDVAPSPSWRLLAWGRPFTVNPGEQDTVPLDRWQPVADRVGIDPALVAAGSFPISGMSYARGFAQPVIASLRPPTFRDETESDPNGLPMSGGWRVRWTLDARLAAFGTGPERGQADAPAPSWILIDPETREVRDTIADITQLARVPWNIGPTIDSGEPPDVGVTRRFRAGDLTVESAGGFIRVSGAEDGQRRTRIIGPGLPLGATRNAQFIAALIPRAAPASGEPAVRYVVYQVNR